MRLSCVCLGVLLAAPWVSLAQTEPVLVHDFTGPANPLGPSTAPTEGFLNSITSGVGRILFIATTYAEGDELWTSDGSQAGTGLVADIGPGRVGGLTLDAFTRVMQPLVPFGGGVAFSSGSAVWVSDGTPTGTHSVFERSSTFLLEQAGELYFLAPHTTDYTSEILYRSDGTPEGTQPVVTVPRPYSSGSRILRLGSGVAVLTRDAWLRSDGTAAGTHVICPSIASDNVVGTADALYYTAQTGQNAWALRRVDAATGANTLVFDALPGVGPTSIYPLFVVGTRIFFPAGDGGLWSTDGTLPGTVRVAGYPSDQAIAGDGRVAVYSTSPGLGGVWVTDGTAAGSRRVDPGAATDLAFQGSELFFARGAELWRSDGTQDGATLVVDLAPLGRGDLSNLGSGPQALFFRLGTSELWKSDGTPGGTSFVSTIGVNNVLHGNPFALRAFDDALLFSGPWSDLYAARAGAAVTALGNRVVLGELNGHLVLDEKLVSGARRLSLSDATLAGTVPYTEITRSLTNGPFPLGEVSGRIIFHHNDASGEALWSTDGTAAGTGLMRAPMRLGFSTLRKVAVDQIYFGGDDGSGFGVELMVTDGTAAGTHLAVDLAAGAADGIQGPIPFATLGRIGFFRRYTAAYGSEVWRTDGTPEGTQLVADVWPGSTSSIPGGFATTPARVFFSASSPNSNPIGAYALFSVDPAGPTATQLRENFDISSSTGGSVVIGDRIFVTNGSELFVSDGTRDGTLLTREISPGTAMSRPAQLASIRGRAVFQACEPFSGCELWASDGTASGTRRLTDLAPGNRSSSPEQITLVRNDLYFTAITPQTGREVFRLSLGECGDGAIGPLEECDDGNTGLLDGCDTTCDVENVLKLFGRAEGGDVTLVVEGLSFVIPTQAGEGIAALLERIAAVLNGSSILRLRGIHTTADGWKLFTDGEIESVEIDDPGLMYDAVDVPFFPTPWAWVALALALAATARLPRRASR